MEDKELIKQLKKAIEDTFNRDINGYIKFATTESVVKQMIDRLEVLLLIKDNFYLCSGNDLTLKGSIDNEDLMRINEYLER